MRALDLLLVLLAAAPSWAGTWTRVSRTTLKFDGKIMYDEYDRFAPAYDGGVQELIVDSPGGVTESAIKIAHVLASSRVKVIVAGECLSSCANYFFVAGHEREIRHGIVGYHGNVKACFDSPEQRREMAERMKNEYRMSDEDIKKDMDRLDQEIEDEARLLAMMGVDQALFDRTCADDKGRGDGRAYAFLLPKKETFEKYRIYGVVGEQDQAIMAGLAWPYAND